MADGGDGQLLEFRLPGISYPPKEEWSPYGFNGDGNTVAEPPPEPLKEPSKSAILLAEAIDLLEGERAKQHGDKLALHTTMAGLITAYLRAVTLPLTPKDAAMIEVCLKMARTCHGELNMDDFRDGAAYFGIAGELASVSRP